VFLYYLIPEGLKSKKLRKYGILTGGGFAFYPCKLPLFVALFGAYFNI
jgi:hypothetical protein